MKSRVTEGGMTNVHTISPVPAASRPSPDDRRAPVAPELFRAVLAHAPSPVAVVTGMSPDGPVGLSVGSFVSVSLDPTTEPGAPPAAPH
jgi:hypothetical protein